MELHFKTLVATALLGGWRQKMGKLVQGTQVARSKYQDRRSLSEPVERRCSCIVFFNGHAAGNRSLVNTQTTRKGK